MANRLFIFFLFLSLLSSAQNSANSTPLPSVKTSPNPPGPINGTLVRTIIYQGEVIPFVNLPPVICSAKRIFKNKRDAAKWDRIKYNVKKVYPYAILAAAKLKEYDRILANIPNENERKKYTKEAEEQLKDQFGEELKSLSMTQGRILLKLIDRETGKTTYTIVREMRGSLPPSMWQSVSLLFNSNLKDEYDAKGDDKAIEDAITLIENGDF